jgi:L-rhamnose mutarotase
VPETRLAEFQGQFNINPYNTGLVHPPDLCETKYFFIMRYCLTLDLQDDPGLIAEYEEHHRKVWPEIKKSIHDAGIIDMEIFRQADRLFMIMETADSFSFEHKAAMDAINSKVQEWEELMWKYQRPIKGSQPGEKWILMERIFALNA